MLLSQDFYGVQKFIWWTGVVENINDPLKIGSIQVRIIGLHPFLDETGTPNKTLLPTDKLPWAQVMLPITGANMTNGPREGEWVFGFFQDGEYAQMPVVMGIFPGIQSVQSSIIYSEAVRRDGGSSTKPIPSQVDRVIGEPITPRIARGVMEGTLVNQLNQERKHVCDISPEVNKATSYIRAQFGVVVQALRDAIRALLLALGFEPSGEVSRLVQLAKAIAREIKYVTSIINEVNQLTKEVIEIAKQIRAMIDYILSLPEKTRKFLNECLRNFYQALATGIGDLFAKPSVGISTGDFKALTDAFNDIANESKKLLAEVSQTLTLPIQIAESLINPASSQDVTRVEQKINEYITNNIPSSETLISENTYNINTAQA